MSCTATARTSAVLTPNCSLRKHKLPQVSLLGAARLQRRNAPDSAQQLNGRHKPFVIRVKLMHQRSEVLQEPPTNGCYSSPVGSNSVLQLFATWWPLLYAACCMRLCIFTTTPGATCALRGDCVAGTAPFRGLPVFSAFPTIFVRGEAPLLPGGEPPEWS